MKWLFLSTQLYQKSFKKDNEWLTPSQFNLRDWLTYLTSTQKVEEEEHDDEEGLYFDINDKR